MKEFLNFYEEEPDPSSPQRHKRWNPGPESQGLPVRRANQDLFEFHSFLVCTFWLLSPVLAPGITTSNTSFIPPYSLSKQGLVSADHPFF